MACAGLCACAGSDDEGAATPSAGQQVPVSFTTSVSTTASDDDGDAGRVTRATTGLIASLDDLKELGFGVFAYRTGNDAVGSSDYSRNWAGATTNSDYTPIAGTADAYPTPDFMQNQQVYWGNQYQDEATGDWVQHWMYDPPKYWPNSTDNAAPRFISFFAYAPYFSSSDVSTNTSGITGLTGVTVATVDGQEKTDKSPHLYYKVPTRLGDQIDLLWANCIDATRNGNGLITIDGDTHTYQDVPLTFHHALSRLDVYVQRIYDGTVASPYEANDTKIFVGQLQLSAGNTMCAEGRLNLVNGKWTAEPASDFSFTFDTNDMNPWVAGTTEGGESFIRAYELDKWLWKWTDDGQRDDANGEQPTGVIGEERLLNQSTRALMFIPIEGQTITLTPRLKYSFVTRDEALQYDYLTDASGRRFNRQFFDRQAEPIKLTMEQGKYYKLLCHIGVEHISFEVVSVEDWDFPMRFTTTVEATTPETREIDVKEE